MGVKTQERTRVIVPVSDNDRRVIEGAAKATGCTVEEFIVASSRTRAQEVLRKGGR
jgi:uncharacterized protein (DUF1778 family)